MKVSILVPVYNVEKYIERCAVTLMEQTYQNIEYIFVNDCSTDGTVDILKQIIAKYPERSSQVTIVDHIVNRGVAAARNTAVSVCRGDYLTMVDSDDYLELDAVSSLAEVAENTNADIVSGNALIHYPDHLVVLEEPSYVDKESMLLETLDTTLNHVIWKRLIRTDLYKRNNIEALEGLNIGEDHQVLPRLVYYASTVAKLDKIIYHYDSTNSFSVTYHKITRFAEQRYEQDIKTIDFLECFFKDKGEQYVNKLQKVRIKRLRNYLADSIVFRDRKHFDEILSRIEEMPKAYYSTIHWNNPAIKWVDHHMMLRDAVDKCVKLYRNFRNN